MKIRCAVYFGVHFCMLYFNKTFYLKVTYSPPRGLFRLDSDAEDIVLPQKEDRICKRDKIISS